MSRRKNPNASDALLDLASRLPWWLDVALAAILYAVLHRVASQDAAVAMKAGQMGDAVTGALWKGLATAGQYLLPFIFLLSAAASALRRRERRALVAGVAQGRSAEALDGMSWREFEVLVGEAFRLQGWQVVETGGGGADGGVDLVLRRDGETHLVQCKQWKAFKVGVQVVRELYGVMATRGAAGGFVVTSGRFTDEAVAFASGRNVRLVDGHELFGLISQAQAARAGKTGTAGAQPTAPAATAPVSTVPGCPACSKPMVLRLARFGANAGNAFWGCTDYPACKGTRTASA